MLKRKTSYCAKCGNTIDGRAPACDRCGSKRVQTFLSSAHLELIDHLRKEMNYSGLERLRSVTEEDEQQQSDSGTTVDRPSSPHFEDNPV